MTVSSMAKVGILGNSHIMANGTGMTYLSVVLKPPHFHSRCCCLFASETTAFPCGAAVFSLLKPPPFLAVLLSFRL